MKKILILFLCILANQLIAQKNYPTVKKTVIKDHIYHGTIDKYPITLYLKFKRYSNSHMGAYSLEGWYYYKNVKSKIPIVGIFDYTGLTLYYFKDTAKSHELLNFTTEKRNHWEDMDYYKNMNGYQEKFELNNDTFYWLKGKRKLRVNLFEKNLNVLRITEHLHLDSNTVFNLSQFDPYEFKLYGAKNGSIILEYEHMSRQYVMGMCGAGTESGFLFLEFDSAMNLAQYKQFTLESCNASIVITEVRKVNNFIIYECENYSNDSSYEIKIDSLNMTISQSKS